MDRSVPLVTLFQRYLESTATEQEITELMTIVSNPEYADDLKQIINNAFDEHTLELAIRPEVQTTMLNRIFEDPGHNRIFHIPRWKKLAVAASIIICTAVGAFFLLHKKLDLATAIRQETERIAPGGNKATLTLANGNSIILTGARNGKLTLQGNVSVNKTTDGEITYQGDGQTAAIQYNTLTTPRGGQYHLILSDGTQVWLNAASSIKYPTAFTGHSRAVEITGEVFFEVAHQPNAPFRVIAADQVINDIGTVFNVNAYPDEPAVRTTLVSGAVAVHINRNPIKVLKLEVGQQACSVPASDNLTVQDVDISSVTAWHEGFFRFDNADIKTVMRQFARWYNIEIAFEGNLQQHEFVGRISRQASLQKVLRILTDEGIYYRLNGHKLTILP